MLRRIVLFIALLAVAPPTLASTGSAARGDGLCSASLPTIRRLWQEGRYDAPPTVNALMIDVIDGHLSPTRGALTALPPAERVRWRQVALLTAVEAGRPAIVDALLDDGAAVDDTARLPPLRQAFYRRLLDDMAHDPHPGGLAAGTTLQAAGIADNRGSDFGPALTVAANCGDPAMVDVLLRHHANAMPQTRPHVADALMIAVVHGNASIVAQLLDHGADPCQEDRRIRKPGVTTAGIGRRRGLPASLVERLACRTPGSAVSG